MHEHGMDKAQPAAATPTRLGRYRVVGILGRGTHGVTCLGQDATTGREVAIKVLPAATAEEAQAVAAEARSAIGLSHPAIVPLHDAGAHEANVFLAYEHVRGETLRQLLGRHETVAPERAVAIVCRMLDGLEYAHENGVLHRDIRPANVMIGEDGLPRLLDFGAAMRCAPAYQAPEVVHGARTTEQSDLYAVGLVLYELVTGRSARQQDGDPAALAEEIAARPLAIPAEFGLDE